jgi:hypothetical protein
VNGTNAGTNNSAFTYFPVQGDQVSCILTSNATCTTGNPATSNVATMSVLPTLAVGSISANQSICADATPAALSGTAPLNGTLPTYLWQSSQNNVSFSNIAGATTQNYQPGSLSVTTYYRQLQNASGTCGGPLPTNTVAVTVNPLLLVEVSVAASANPVCAGTSVTFTAIPVNGGPTPLYQWLLNGSQASGATNLTYTFTPADGDIVSCQLSSNEPCATGNPAISGMTEMTVKPLLPVSISIAASANPVDNGTPVTFTATAENGGASPVYQWTVNGSNAGTNNNVFMYVPVNGDVVSCMLTSDETCTSSNPANSNAIIMVVNAVPATLNLQNLTVTGTECFDALATISVAGNETLFSVPDGDSATMIAGLNILYYPGTVVAPGGYLYGYIAPDGPWCFAPQVPAVLTATTESMPPQNPQHFRVYPNPTTGSFMLELNGSDPDEQCLVEIYDMKGKKISSDEWAGNRKREFSLSGQPAGIYLVRVISGQISGTTRIIRQK